MMRHSISQVIAIAGLAVAACSPSDDTSTSPDIAEDHFHPKGKPPSEHTIKVLKEARAGLPFADKRDFAEQSRGFIAAPESKQLSLSKPTSVNLH